MQDIHAPPAPMLEQFLHQGQYHVIFISSITFEFLLALKIVLMASDSLLVSYWSPETYTSCLSLRIVGG